MEMVRQMAATRIQAGTVLNGVLDDEISSKKSKVGDIFSVSLPEGLQKEGQEILPKMTKIVGTVTSVISAKMQRTAAPGNVGISLQTLVLPDGRHTQFYGFLDHNPLLNAQRSTFYNPASTATKYGRSITAGLTRQLTRSVGIRNASRPTGPDLVLEKGEPIVLRVNRSLDLNSLQAPAAQGFVPGMPPVYAPPSSQGAVPGLVGPNAMMAPGPGMVGPNAMMAPGVVPGMASPQAVPGMMPPQAVPGLVPGARGQAPGMTNDPLFNQPIGAQGKVELPDPF